MARISFFLFCLLLWPVTSSAESTIAAILPLTGNGSDQGEWARRGFELARQHLGNADLNIVYEDSKGGDPGTAVQAYTALKHRKKFPAVLTYGSSVGMALTPLVNADRVLQMGIATATPKYRTEGDFTFRTFPSATMEADFLAESLIDKLSASEVAVLSINNDYGAGTSAAFKTAFGERGGKITIEDSYNPGEQDFRSILLKLKKLPGIIVYLAVYPTDGALLLKQARELGLKNQFLSSVAIMGGKDFFDLAGDAAEGLMVVSTMGDSNSRFAREYEIKFPGESPAQQMYAARAYDALTIIGEALGSCKTSDTDCIKEQLFRVKDYPGASGKLSFDSAGDVTSSFALFKISGRKFAVVQF